MIAPVSECLRRSFQRGSTGEISSFCSQVQKNKETLEWSPHAQVRYSVEIVAFPCKLIERPSLQHDSNTESANICLPQAVQSPMIESKIPWHSTCALLLRNTNNQVFSLHGIDGARIQVIDERLQRQAVSEFAAVCLCTVNPVFHISSNFPFKVPRPRHE